MIFVPLNQINNHTVKIYDQRAHIFIDLILSLSKNIFKKAVIKFSLLKKIHNYIFFFFIKQI